MAKGVELATAYVNLAVSAKGMGKSITQEMSGVEGKANAEGAKSGRSFGSGFVSSAAKIVGGILAYKGVAKAFQFAKTSVFDFNSQLEQANIGFTTMLGSGKKSKAFLDQLQSFAKATPFEFSGLVSNAQTMMGMGVAAKNVIPYLTALGDSVASVGGDGAVLNNTILAFSQTMAKGTLDMGNMNQLLQGGIPNALKILAASYHVTTGEMVKMISSGKVQSSVALPRLIAGIEKGTTATAALGGMMDKQSQTFQGALGNIGDAMTQTTAKAFRPFFTATSGGLQKLADALGSDAVSKWADRSSAALTRLIGKTKTYFETGSGSSFDLFRSGLTMNASDRKQFADSLGDSPIMNMGAQVRAGFDKAQAATTEGLAKVRASMVRESPAIRSTLTSAFSLPPSAADSWGAFASAGLTKAKGALADGWKILSPALSGTLDRLKSIWGKLADTGKRAFAPIMSIVGTLAGAFADAFKTIGGSGLSVWGLLLKAADGLASLLQKYLVPALQAVATWMRNNRPLVAALVTAFVAYRSAMFAINTATKIATTLTAAYTAVQKLLNGAMKANPIGLVIAALAALAAGFAYLWTHSEGFRNFWIGLWDKIKAAATAVANWFMSNVWPIIKRFFDDIKAIVGGIIKVFQGIWEFISGIFTGNWRRAWDGVKKIFTGLWDAIKGYVRLVIDWFGTVPRLIWGAISKLGGWLLARGKDLIGWIWSGIKSGAGAVWSWFSSLPGAAWNAIKSFSKWLTDRGKDLLGWIWSGIKSAASGVWTWFSNLASTVWSKVTHAVGAGGTWLVNKGKEFIGWVVNGIVKGASQLWTWITQIPGKLWDGLKQIGTDLYNIGVGIWNAITGGINAGKSGFQKGGKFVSINKPSTRYTSGVLTAHATGGFLTPGWNLLGEQGPELVQKVGANAKVYTADQTRRMMPAKHQQQPAGPTTMTGKLYLSTGEFLGVVKGVVADDASAQARRLVGAR